MMKKVREVSEHKSSMFFKMHTLVPENLGKAGSLAGWWDTFREKSTNAYLAPAYWRTPDLCNQVLYLRTLHNFSSHPLSLSPSLLPPHPRLHPLLPPLFFSFLPSNIYNECVLLLWNFNILPRDLFLW